MSLPRCDGAAALEFLRWLSPEGPWLLVAIVPDTREVTAKTFRVATLEHARRWLEQHNERSNVYYAVNPPLADLAKKPDREDLSEMRFLHVDVDPRTIDPRPRDGEDEAAAQARLDAHQDAEWARIEALLTTKLPPDVPPPSAVVASGGGYNALWRLEVPVELAGSVAKCEEAKLYNVHLERLFGGDHCHNVDRILRLPGTVNWPDAKKRKRGRRPHLARAVRLTDVAYPIAKFRRAAPVQDTTAGVLGARTGVRVSGNVPKLDAGDLPESVPQKVRDVVAQGEDPDQPGRFKSRSDALFWACCELVRLGLDDEQIYGVITNPALGISASVLDKPDVERYACRQIDRARAKAVHPALLELNDRFAVVGNLGGHCVVIEEVEDVGLDPPRRRLTAQTFADFRNRYLDRTVEAGVDAQGNPREVPLGDWWLRNRQRTYYDRVVFAPGRDVPGAFNLWQGFGVVPHPGDKHLPYLEHVRSVVCSGDPVNYAYLVGWLARCVQSPGEPGEVAVVLRGVRGSGKGTFVREFGKLWGRHFLQIANAEHLVGNFNDHLRDCVVLFADEAFYAGDKRHESVLKALVTEDRLMVTRKHHDSEQAANFLHVLMATNDDWAVPAGSHERRWCVLDVSGHRAQDAAHFGPVRRALDDGGRENLLHYLLTYDLSRFDVRDFPRTSALHDQRLRSMTSEQEWWLRKLEAGAVLPDQAEWVDPVRRDRLLEDYLTYAKDVGVGRRATETVLGLFLKKMLPAGWPKITQRRLEDLDDRGRPVKVRVAFAQLPPLAECRQVFAKVVGGHAGWEDGTAAADPALETPLDAALDEPTPF